MSPIDETRYSYLFYHRFVSNAYYRCLEGDSDLFNRNIYEYRKNDIISISGRYHEPPKNDDSEPVIEYLVLVSLI